MSWYYAREGQRIGPVEEDEFALLVGDGVVEASTLVWRQGMQDWQPYAQVLQENQSAIDAPPDSTDPLDYDRPTPVSESEETIPTESCCQCGRHFSPEEMIPYENAWVCGNCKQNFFQRIQEGLMPGPTLNYAGFWIRWVAKLIDWIIDIIAGVTINVVLGVGFFATLSEDLPVLAAAFFIGAGFRVTYTTFFLGRFGATPGKMACGLKVVRSDGDKISYKRAFCRHYGYVVSKFTIYIGCLMAAFHEEKASLHDLICDTRVISR